MVCIVARGVSVFLFTLSSRILASPPLQVRSNASTAIKRVILQTLLQRRKYPFMDKPSRRIKLQLLLAVLNSELAS